MSDDKPKNKRSKAKYSNLDPRLTSRVRQEYHDISEYAFPLNEEEKVWMNQFMGEYLGASLVLDDNKQIIPEKNLHKDPKYKKELFDANNFRNRDQYGLIKGRVANTKLLNYEASVNLIEEEFSHGVNPASMENAYINFIDHKQLEVIFKEYLDAMFEFKENDE